MLKTEATYVPTNQTFNFKLNMDQYIWTFLNESLLGLSFHNLYHRPNGFHSAYFFQT